MKALRLLGEADVIVHDASVSPAILARAHREATLVAADGDAADRVLGPALAGRTVLCLSAGEPAFLSDAVIARLRQRGVPVEAVPGVPLPVPSSRARRAAVAARSRASF